MNEHPEADDVLERLLSRTLHGLPPRRAPMTLESRVFEELQRRAVLPWWRRSFGHWPRYARAAFLLLCGSLAGLAFLGGDWAVTGVRVVQTSGASMSWARQTAAIMNVAGDVAASVAGAIPASWLYGSLAAGALLYAALFGLGAAAYCMLYLRPLNGR
jgi:hypothetical protein